MNQNDPEPRARPPVRRISMLLAMHVIAPGGRDLGHINDIRLAPGPAVAGVRAELVIDGLVIGKTHAGSLLGYDRRVQQGPRIVRMLVRAMHRGARYVAWDVVDKVDWEERQVHLASDRTEPLEPT
jgi:L-ascorbate metabolism protein UlaG (beta-lactamase superfamily)